MVLMEEWNISIKRVAIISLLVMSMLLIRMAVSVRNNVYAASLEKISIRPTEYYSETVGGRIFVEQSVIYYIYSFRTKPMRNMW